MMDASQPTTSDAAPPGDVEMSQDTTKHVTAATSTGEWLPVLTSDPSNAANPKPKRAPKAVPNADRPSGKSLLPVARVQKIMKSDKELPTCAKEAVFLISVATEEFIKRLGQAGQQQAIRDKRTTVQPRDIGTAVRRLDEFAFLEEILGTGMPAPPAAVPAKRKTKAPAPANDNRNIKEAFGKGKEKATLDLDAPVGNQKAHEISNSGLEPRDSDPIPHDDSEDTQLARGGREGGDGDTMDVS